MERKEQPASSCILAVRLRGTVGDSPDVEKTMDSLMLRKTFQARLLKGNPSNGGMLRRVKSLVAWGEVDPQTLGSLLAKRGRGEQKSMVLDEEFVKRRFNRDGFPELAQSIVTGDIGIEELWRAGLKPFFRLHPPRGGFKRSTRRAFSDGGELGYRGSEINPLVRRMI